MEGVRVVMWEMWRNGGCKGDDVGDVEKWGV